MKGHTAEGKHKIIAYQGKSYWNYLISLGVAKNVKSNLIIAAAICDNEASKKTVGLIKLSS